MTQAFNLAQLANNLNTAGQLDATDGLSGTVPVANGGTGQATLPSNNVILGNGTSGVTGVAPSTSGNVLTSNGTTWQSVAPPNNSIGVGQTWQNLTSSRSPGITYTNTTGKPIMVIVMSQGSNPYGASSEIIVDGIQVMVSVNYNPSDQNAVTAIVPNGSTYSANSSWVYNGWRELR
jgi:hypothetical protein